MNKFLAKKVSWLCVAHPLGARGPACGGEPKDHRIDRPTVVRLDGVTFPMHGFVAQPG